MIEITRHYENFTYKDSGIGVVIEVKQIDADKHYGFNAHITVNATPDNGVWHTSKDKRTGTWIPLYESRSGMVTDTARKALQKAIRNDLMGDEKEGLPGLKNTFGLGHPVMTNDWRFTVRDFCEKIKNLYYEGEPLVNPYDSEEGDDDVWRIPALLTEDINVIYGQSGSGKSYWALVAGEAIHHGVPFSGLRTVQGSVLLLDYETTVQKIRRRLKRVDAGLGIQSGVPMHYMAAKIPLAQMLEGLQTRVVDYGIEFIIVDSLARAVGGPITDEVGVNAMFGALRQLGLPCLVIHHTNRSDDYYGSPFIKAYARSLWRLRSSKNAEQGQLSIQLEQEKENDGPGIGDVGFLLEFVGDPVDPDQVTVSPQHPSMVQDFEKRARLSDQINWKLDRQPQHKVPSEQIYKILKLEKTDAKPALSKAETARASTLRNYLWDMRNKLDGKKTEYKQLHELLLVQLDSQGQLWLCRNSTLGKNNIWEWNPALYEDEAVQSEYIAEPGYAPDVEPQSNGHMVRAAEELGIVFQPEETKQQKRTVRDI